MKKRFTFDAAEISAPTQGISQNTSTQKEQKKTGAET